MPEKLCKPHKKYAVEIIVVLFDFGNVPQSLTVGMPMLIKFIRH